MIDLTPFNDKNDIRPFCREPIRLGTGQVVATDGVSIMAPAQYVGDVGSVLPAPQNVEATVTKYLTMIDQPRDWKPIAGLGALTPEPCQTCGGSGRVTRVECDECDGKGDFHYGRHWYDCKACEGSGEIECEPAGKDSAGSQQCLACHGTGHSTQSSFMKIDGMAAGVGVDARLLARYPSDGEYAISTDDRSPVLLRGAGWRGVLMPMSGGR